MNISQVNHQTIISILSTYLCITKPINITFFMTQESIDKFLFVASKKFPDLISPSMEQKNLREVYDTVAVFVFTLEEPLNIDELKSILDDTFGMVTVYHHLRSRETDYAQSICAFQEPGTGEMFQLNASTNAHGLIVRIDVKLYDSMERMAVEIRDELQRMTNYPGEFFETINEAELLSHFL